jgi:uncharacterized membrane protein (DUF485 family)
MTRFVYFMRVYFAYYLSIFISIGAGWLMLSLTGDTGVGIITSILILMVTWILAITTEETNRHLFYGG